MSVKDPDFQELSKDIDEMKVSFFADRTNYLKISDNIIRTNELLMNETEFLRNLLKNDSPINLQ